MPGLLALALLPPALVGALGCAAPDLGGEDAGSDDGSVRSDAAASDASPAPGLFDPEDDCFDFTDDDGDWAVDCADPGCGAAPVCCALGSETAGCCTRGEPDALELSGCGEGDDARACTGLSGFGSAGLRAHLLEPTECAAAITALSPGPSELADTGVVLPHVLDPAVSRTEIGFVLGVAPRDGLARVGVAVIEGDGAAARVLPSLGVVTSEGQLRVVVGEAEVFRTDDVGACAARIPMRVVLDPGGTVTVYRGADVIYAGAMAMPSRASLAIYGRHDEGPLAAWVGEVSVRRDVCSRLAPERSAAPVVTGLAREATIGRVSVARRTPGELGRAAIEIDGRILPATEVAEGIRVDDAVNPLVPAGDVRSGTPDWAAQARDPQLVATDAGYRLLFTGQDEDGSTAVFATSFSSSLGSPTAPVAIFTSAQASALSGQVVIAIDHPSYVEHQGRGYLIYRATTATATELRIVGLSSVLDAALEADVTPIASPVDVAYSEGITGGVLRQSGTGTGFDRDEVGAARALDVGDGVLRIFYAGRRGTRWAIGALVTADLSHFDQVEGGEALLGPSGAGFDALGVLSPEPVLGLEPDGSARLSLYYTGTSGTASSLGAASQAIFVGGPR